MDIKQEFLDELKDLLKKYQASITVRDHWQGYPECGQDLRMEVEFNNYVVGDIDMGSYVDERGHYDQG